MFVRRQLIKSLKVNMATLGDKTVFFLSERVISMVRKKIVRRYSRAALTCVVKKEGKRKGDSLRKKKKKR